MRLRQIIQDEGGCGMTIANHRGALAEESLIFEAMLHWGASGDMMLSAKEP